MRFLRYTCMSFLLAFSCSAPPVTYTVEEIDGVRHVHNRAPLWGNAPKVKLEFVQKIGELETEDENYLLYRPYDVCVDRDQNIFILDRGNDRIQKYDRSGNYLATIGGRGQGPGEFDSPVWMEMDGKGNLYVRNFARGTCIVLDPAGNETGRVDFPITAAAVTPGGQFIGQAPTEKRAEFSFDEKKHRLIAVYGKNGELVRSFGRLHDYQNDDLTYFGNTVRVYADDEYVYAAFMELNRIDKYTLGGEYVLRFDRPLEFEEKHWTEKYHHPIEDKDYFLPHFNAVSRSVHVDHKDRIWALTYIKQEERDSRFIDIFRFDVFSSDGVYLGSLKPPVNFSTIHITGSRLFLLDSLEEMCVNEYRIVDLEG